MVLEDMIDPDRILVEVSNRHVHLSEEHLEKLFGSGYTLTPYKNLSQPGQYAAGEKITLQNNGRELPNVRIIGPTREHTQVEISATDSRYLEVNAPCKLSGDIHGTPGITLVGPRGTVALAEGVIIAQRHLHIPYDDAKHLGIKNNQRVSLSVVGTRPVTYHEIVVRTGPAEKTTVAVHLDSDEGNSALLGNNQYGRLII
ncbi:MAG: hypothetical protein RL557_339 [archaeon]|jgi:putative phosphotransacetylase